MASFNIQKIIHFLSVDIWRVTEDEVSRWRCILYNMIKIGALSVREFLQGGVINKASALTYSTLLAIIPALALLFAIARGFGLANLLEDQIRRGSWTYTNSRSAIVVY